MYFIPFYGWRIVFRPTGIPHLLTHSYVFGYWVIRPQRLLHRLLWGHLLTSSGALPRSGIAGRSVLNFLKNCQPALQRLYHFMHPSTVGGLQSLHHTLIQHLLPSIFLISRSRGHEVAAHCGFQFEFHKCLIMLNIFSTLISCWYIFSGKVYSNHLLILKLGCLYITEF